LRGFGQFFALFFLNQAATSAVAHEFAEDASGLFNAARNLGGSMGLSAIGALQDQRNTFHTARLTEAISANSVLGQDAVAQRGVGTLFQQIEGQAAVMTFADLYWVLGVAIVLMIPLVFLLKPLPKGASLSPRDRHVVFKPQGPPPSSPCSGQQPSLELAPSAPTTRSALAAPVSDAPQATSIAPQRSRRRPRRRRRAGGRR